MTTTDRPGTPEERLAAGERPAAGEPLAAGERPATDGQAGPAERPALPEVPPEAASAGTADGDLSASATRLVCRGCGWRPSPDDPAPLHCPAWLGADGIDHVLVRELDPRLDWPGGGETNPFVRYRTLFHAYHAARRLGCSDADYVGCVERLDRELERVDGRRFRVTPFGRAAALSERLGFGGRGGVFVKDETRNVSGSHKARHLAGTLLELEVGDAVRAGECAGSGDTPPRGVSTETPLAIASCGNAALAAAVVARAAGRRLLVFIPPDAEPSVVARLRELGATLTVCEREPGQSGDPTYHALLEALRGGAIPFTCQGNLNGLAIEGGETLGFELVDALLTADPRRGEPPRLDRILVQVGGGALASSVVAAFADARRLGVPVSMPRIHAVQTSGAFPLARAYRRLADRLLRRPVTDPENTAAILAAPSEADLDELQAAMEEPRGSEAIGWAAAHRDELMWPWETEPHSVAHGILDDETYDWLAVVEGMLASGGYPVVVDEPTLEAANALARETTASDVDHTGSSGLAGLVELGRRGVVRSDERVGVLFTGVLRAPAAHRPSASSAAGPAAEPVSANPNPVDPVTPVTE